MTEQSKGPTLHEQYVSLSYRPVIKADGTVGMVGVMHGGPACVEPGVYPNLAMAAPALYQQLFTVTHALRRMAPGEHFNEWDLQSLVEQSETALAFALHGWIMPKIDTSQFGK